MAKKSYNKFVASAATATLVASALVPTAALAAETGQVFNDVKVDSKYFEATKYLKEKGINGVGGNNFDVVSNIKRGDAIVFLAKSLGFDLTQKVEDQPAGLTDLGNRAELKSAVAQLVELPGFNGTIGKGNGLLDPHSNITRGEIALLVNRAYNLPKGDESFTDTKGTKYEEAVQNLVAAGATQGVGNGKFGVHNDVKRGDLAIFLYKSAAFVPEIDVDVEELVEAAKASLEAAKKAYDVAAKELTAETIAAAKKAVADAQVAVDAVVKADEEAAKDLVAELKDLTAKVEELKVVEEAKVVSVKAINAKEIAVTFNQEMDKSTVEAAIDVEEAGNPTTLTSTSVLQDDKKTVIVTLATAMTNKKGYDVKVATTAETVKGEKLEKAYVHTFQFNDTVAPTVKGITVKEDGTVEVAFSEKVTNTTPSFVVNGGAPITGTVNPQDDSKYNVSLSGVKAGETVNLIVSDAVDYAGNKMSIYSTSFKYDYTVNAPKVSKLAAKDEDTIELEFSKDVAVLTAGTEVKVFLNGVELTAATDYTLTPVSGSNSKYTLDFTQTASNGLNKLYANNATQATVKVVAEQYKDTLQPANMGTKVEQNIVMKKDTVKPALKGSLVYKAADQTLTANLTKKTAGETAANLAGKIYVLDPSTGVRYDVEAAPATRKLSVAAVADGSDKIILTNGDALSNGTYQLVIEAGAITDKTFGENKNDRIVSTFTVTGASSTAKPEVDTVAYKVGSNDVIEVTYKTAAVDITATNNANYKLNGKALPTGTVITLDAAKTVATITLPEGSFAKTENQVLTIENVKSVDGVTMDKHEEVFEVIDNAQPKLTGASLVNGDIILTFSENVDTTTVGTAFVNSDFKIVLNGAPLAATTNYTVVDKNSTPGDSSLKENQVKISPVTATGINFTTAATLTVEIADGAAMKDAAGNAVVTGTEIKVK